MASFAALTFTLEVKLDVLSYKTFFPHNKDDASFIQNQVQKLVNPGDKQNNDHKRKIWQDFITNPQKSSP